MSRGSKDCLQKTSIPPGLDGAVEVIARSPTRLVVSTHDDLR